MTGKAICLFCGSRAGESEGYRALAESVGRAIGERGATMVYGGGALGLMGIASNAAIDAGGTVTGIIPNFLRSLEVENPRLTRAIVTDNMFDRKQAMLDLSDGFLILPGGLGTFDELFEVLTWRQLGQIDKPIVLLSDSGYWEPYVALIEHVIREGFAGSGVRSLYTVVGTIEDAFAALGLDETAA
ncbi:MAG TPA: TIGR00730 family Rossman fold protein [Alphaproteobacteria bacterium]|nr:TIGR00730 family Rossman fold protein [Alphaproteobacteria bacterium]